MKIECDCDIIYSTDYDIQGNKQITMTIQYCSMHEAAPELLDALKALVDTPAKDIDKFGVWDKAYQALALVKGKNNDN